MLIFFLVSCKNETKKTDETNLKAYTKEESDLQSKTSLIARHRKLRYGNEYFTLKTKPFIDSASNKYTVEVSLSNSKTTVFVKLVNTDSLLRLIEKDKLYLDSIGIMRLEQHQMIDIAPTSGIRGYNAYLIAKLSNKNAPDLYITFVIKAFGDQRSKKGYLWIPS